MEVTSAESSEEGLATTPKTPPQDPSSAVGELDAGRRVGGEKMPAEEGQQMFLSHFYSVTFQKK